MFILKILPTTLDKWWKSTKKKKKIINNSLVYSLCKLDGLVHILYLRGTQLLFAPRGGVKYSVLIDRSNRSMTAIW